MLFWQKIGSGSADLLIFGTRSCNQCCHKQIQQYKHIFDCVRDFNRKPANVLLLFFEKWLFIIHFAVKITTLTQFANGFTNCSTTIMFAIRLQYKCRSCDPRVWRYEFCWIFPVLWFSDGQKGLQRLLCACVFEGILFSSASWFYELREMIVPQVVKVTKKTWLLFSMTWRYKALIMIFKTTTVVVKTQNCRRF